MRIRTPARSALALSLLLPFSACDKPTEPPEVEPPPAREIAFSKNLRLGVMTISGDSTVEITPMWEGRQIYVAAQTRAGLSWSPDGEEVAVPAATEFTCSKTGGCRPNGLYLVDVHSGSARKLGVQDSISVSAPAWSPDGGAIAFASGGAIYRIDVAGGNPARLTAPELGGYSPAWSPDGSKIVFAGVGAQLHVMNSDGSGLRDIDTGVDPATHPHWHPNGHLILFTGGLTGTSGPGWGGLYTIDPEGGPATRLPININNKFVRGRWSQDGSQIAFDDIEGYEFTSGRIYIVNADGSDLRQLGEGASPTWRPCPDCDGAS